MARKQYLNEEQVNEVLEFSERLWAAEKYGIDYFPGIYSPWIQNQMLNNLNNNPAIPSIDSIKNALSNYKNQATELQSYVEFMQHWDMIFARTVMSYANMLSFDLMIFPPSDISDEELQSLEYREDLNRIYKFLSKFDYKSEFRKMTIEMLRHETVFTWFRKTKWGNKGMKCALQILPQDRCMLTGYWEKGMLFDFDMSYFLGIPGVDIDAYDPIFKTYLNRIFEQYPGINQYIPSNPLNKRDGTYALWVQTSPEDGAWTFKFDTSNFNSTPFLAPLLKNAFRDEELAELQYNKDLATAHGLLVGEIKTFNQNTGNKSNQFVIAPEIFSAFMAKVKAGLSKALTAVGMPTENTDFYQYQDYNKDMYSNQLSTTAGTGSSISRVVYSSDRQSNAELQYAVENDYSTMKPLYQQFSNFLSFFANKLTHKYKFDFVFDGSNYEVLREKRIEKLLKFADRGILFNSSVYASALGMQPQHFDVALRQGRLSDMTKYLTVLLNTNTTKDGGLGGRPRVDDDLLSDSGESSREDLGI